MVVPAMANARILGALVSVVVLSWGISLLFSSSQLRSTLVSPDEFLWRLKGFQQLISCADFSSGSQCFRRYGPRLLTELKSVVEASSFHRLTECFTGVLKEDRDSLVFLQLSRCIHESGVESLLKNLLSEYAEHTSGHVFLHLPRLGFGESDTYIWIVYTLATFFVLVIPLLFASLGWTGDVVEAVGTGKEVTVKYPHAVARDVSSFSSSDHTSRPIIVKLLDEVYDLSNEADLKKWRDKFKLRRPDPISPVQGESKYILPVYGPGAESVKNCSNANISGTHASSHDQAHGDTELRARSDVNIRDPSRPVPSVLHFPRTDHKGKVHHRVFLPGRGWLSMAELERERRELLAQLQGVPKSLVSPRKDMRNGSEKGRRIRALQTVATKQHT